MGKANRSPTYLPMPFYFFLSTDLLRSRDFGRGVRLNLVSVRALA